MNRADPAAANGPRAVGQFITDVLRRQHGTGLRIPSPTRQAFLNSRLASSQFLMCSTVHFKRLLICAYSTTTQTASDAERQAFEVFLF
jgi:hypothetical protein